MRITRFAMCVCLLAFSSAASAQDAVPSGTIIPARLNSSLSFKMQPGTAINATVTQDISFSGTMRIPAGAKLIGHIVSVATPSDGGQGRIGFTFDRLIVKGKPLAVHTDLRAMASFMEVNEARIPTGGADRGTPESERTTLLIGGDVDYRADGPVMEGADVVGKPTFDGVLDQVRANSRGSCRAAVDGNYRPQALWVFSSDACGLYGFSQVAIAHAGRSAPYGQITLTSRRSRLRIASGAALLLRVVNSESQTWAALKMTDGLRTNAGRSCKRHLKETMQGNLEKSEAA
jgi:hypothetical protein